MSSLAVLGVVRVSIMRSVVRVLSAPDANVVVVVVVEFSPLTGSLTEILVIIKVSPEGLVGADPGGGLGVAQARLVRVRQLPLWCVAALSLTVTVIDPISFLAVLNSYRSTGSHHGTTRFKLGEAAVALSGTVQEVLVFVALVVFTAGLELV